MKPDIAALCWLNVLIIVVLIYKCFDMIVLLDDRSLVTRAAIPLEEPMDEPRIPKIIHQTYKTDEIPEVWRASQQSILDLNPEYEYMFWSDAAAREFILEHYAWFLPTFDSYEYPIMRADALRYFVLYHYGGIYIDLDNGVTQSLDALLGYGAFFRKTKPTGVSNDIMGGIPKHPFFASLMHELTRHKQNFLMPYLTIMYSTGPLFVSIMLRKFMRCHSSAADPSRVRILMPGIAEKFVRITDYFYTVQGSSWHNDDASFVLFMLRHWIMFFILYAILFLVLLATVFVIELTLINTVMCVSRQCYRLVASDKLSIADTSLTCLLRPRRPSQSKSKNELLLNCDKDFDV